MSRSNEYINSTTGKDFNIPEVIRLQLRKPKTWNWELSTSKSSPHIPLPIIQLYDNKRNLLVETKAYDRKSWHVNDTKTPKVHSFTFETSYYKTPSSTSLTTSKRQSNYLDNQKLNTEDKIRIKQHILKKSRSDLFPTRKTNYKPPQEEITNTSRYKRNKEKYTESTITDVNQNKYTLRSCSAGTLVIKEDSIKHDVKRRRRRKPEEYKDNSSSGSSDECDTYRNYRVSTNYNSVVNKNDSAKKIIRRNTTRDLSSISEVRNKYDKKKNNSCTDLQYKEKMYDKQCKSTFIYIYFFFAKLMHKLHIIIYYTTDVIFMTSVLFKQ